MVSLNYQLQLKHISFVGVAVSSSVELHLALKAFPTLGLWWSGEWYANGQSQSFRKSVALRDPFSILLSAGHCLACEL